MVYRVLSLRWRKQEDIWLFEGNEEKALGGLIFLGNHQQFVFTPPGLPQSQPAHGDYR